MRHNEVISACHITEAATVLIAYQSPTNLDASLDETVAARASGKDPLRIATHDKNQQEKPAQTNSIPHPVDLEDAVDF